MEAFWISNSESPFAKIEHLFRIISRERPFPELLAYVAYRIRQHFPVHQADALTANLISLDPPLSRLFACDDLERFCKILRGKAVLFISEQPSERELELSEAASFAGWKSILVYERKPNYDPSKYFGVGLEIPNAASILLLSFALRPTLCHVFTKGGGYAGLLHCRFKPAPVVFDYYDTAAGMSLPWAIENSDAEKFCMASADAMTHRDLRAHHLRRDKGYLLPPHNIFVPDLIRSMNIPFRSSKPNGEIHVVSCGWVGAPEAPRNDNSIYRVVEALSDKGIFVHIYPNPIQDAHDFRCSPLRRYKELEDKTPFFKLHRPIGYDSFFDEIRRYDFGLAVMENFLFGEPLKDHTIECLVGCGSSRVKNYIEMGLPVIISPELRYQFFVASRYGYTVPATREFLRNPRPALEEALGRKRMPAPNRLSKLSTSEAARRLGKLYETVTLQQRAPMTGANQ